MKKVGIRFKSAGKVYDFDSGAFVLNVGDNVIVETDQGLGLGSVAIPPQIFDPASGRPPLRKVFRLAGEKDFEQKARNQIRVNKAHAFCLKCIKQLGLKMNLFAVESTFDGNKLTFFFTSDGRVDFRQLVKMLVKELGVKIEMRQVGIRNQAKMCGGIGRCGRQICCSTFIEKFEPVSIRMAKEQSLSLNPTKISGQCGRLMCCLTYENATYQALKKNFPKIGRRVVTDQGKGKVIRQNVICGRVAVRLLEGPEIEVTLDKVEIDRSKPEKNQPRSNQSDRPKKGRGTQGRGKSGKARPGKAKYRKTKSDRFKTDRSKSGSPKSGPSKSDASKPGPSKADRPKSERTPSGRSGSGRTGPSRSDHDRATVGGGGRNQRKTDRSKKAGEAGRPAKSGPARPKSKNRPKGTSK